MDSGAYLDAEEVVAAALALHARDKQASFLAAVQVGIDELERGEGIRWTPELHDHLFESARRRAAAGDRPNDDALPTP